VLFSADRYLAFLFHCWLTLINPFTDCFQFHGVKLPALLRKFCNNCSVSKTKFPQCLDLSFISLSSYDSLPITKVIGLTAIMTWNIEEFNAMLHVNIKIMASQQRWYLLLSYFNNEISFLFSCEIRSWSLHFRQFDICQVNTAQGNTLVHSIVTNKCAKFGAKISRLYWDTAIFLLGYFILPHPVHREVISCELLACTSCLIGNRVVFYRKGLCSFDVKVEPHFVSP